MNINSFTAKNLLFTILLVSLIPSLSVSSQVQKKEINPVVVLKGKVDSLSIERVDSSSFKLVARLKLELVNSGKKPLIFLKELRGYQVPIFTGATLSSISTGEALVQDNFGESFDRNSPFWLEYRKALDTAAPSAEKTRFLAPDKSIEFEDTVEIYLPTEATKDSNFPKRASFEELKALANIKLQVTYRSWSGSLETSKGSPSFSDELQKRWKDYGKLWVDNLVSEPILLNLELVSVTTAKK